MVGVLPVARQTFPELLGHALWGGAFGMARVSGAWGCWWGMDTCRVARRWMRVLWREEEPNEHNF